ncbi:MAG: hypothetical protein IKY40_02595, partial [Phascolarctobacterium sp.]|nr:hypothetical protein [Phascolarctobacterium sp.]
MPTVAQEFRSSYFSKSSNFRHQMNPAFLDDSYATALMGQVNVGATGNVGLGNFIYDAGDGSDHDYVSFMDKKVDKDAFLSDLESENTFDLYLNYNLFSVGFKAFGGSNLIELNMRSAVNTSVPYEFFKFAKEEGEGNQYEFENLSLNTQNYMELAFGHARNLNEKLRVGAKVKVLLGAAYADFKVNHLQLEKNIPAIGSNADLRLDHAPLTAVVIGLNASLIGFLIFSLKASTILSFIPPIQDLAPSFISSILPLALFAHVLNGSAIFSLNKSAILSFLSLIQFPADVAISLIFLPALDAHVLNGSFILSLYQPTTESFTSFIHSPV